MAIRHHDTNRCNMRRVHKWQHQGSRGRAPRGERRMPCPDGMFGRRNLKDLQNQRRSTDRENWGIFPCRLRLMLHPGERNQLSSGSFLLSVWIHTISWVLLPDRSFKQETIHSGCYENVENFDSDEWSNDWSVPIIQTTARIIWSFFRDTKKRKLFQTLFSSSQEALLITMISGERVFVCLYSHNKEEQRKKVTSWRKDFLFIIIWSILDSFTIIPQHVSRWFATWLLLLSDRLVFVTKRDFSPWSSSKHPESESRHQDGIHTAAAHMITHSITAKILFQIISLSSNWWYKAPDRSSVTNQDDDHGYVVLILLREDSKPES